MHRCARSRIKIEKFAKEAAQRPKLRFYPSLKENFIRSPLLVCFKPAMCRRIGTTTYECNKWCNKDKIKFLQASNSKRCSRTATLLRALTSCYHRFTIYNKRFQLFQFELLGRSGILFKEFSANSLVVSAFLRHNWFPVRRTSVFESVFLPNRSQNLVVALMWKPHASIT